MREKFLSSLRTSAATGIVATTVRRSNSRERGPLENHARQFDPAFDLPAQCCHSTIYLTDLLMLAAEKPMLQDAGKENKNPLEIDANRCNFRCQWRRHSGPYVAM